MSNFQLMIGQFLINKIRSGRSNLTINDISKELCLTIETVQESFAEYPPLNILFGGLDDPNLKKMIAGKNIDDIFEELLTNERIMQIKEEQRKKRNIPPNDVA